jgi:predicted ATPase
MGGWSSSPATRGVGKTALVRRFCDSRRGSARILSGACDALFTPRPLGPLIDIAEATGGELQELVGSGARPHQLAAALVRELGTRAPTIVVLEDLHWADEATLDVLRLIARRVEAVYGLLLASYRDEAFDPAAPLRIVLGARDRLRDRSRSVGSVVVGCRGAARRAARCRRGGALPQDRRHSALRH